jgi:hypothetical protein
VVSCQLHLEQKRAADQTAENPYAYIRQWMDSDITGHARHSILAHLFNVSSDYLDSKNYAKVRYGYSVPIPSGTFLTP